jgi:hypothetical protein
LSKIFSFILIFLTTALLPYMLHIYGTDIVSYANPSLENKVFFPGKASFGVVVHTPLASENMKSVGVKWVRHEVSWNSIEQKKGSYDFTKLDLAINDFIKNKLNILLLLNLYERNPFYSVKVRNKDIEYEGYSKFINALVQRYREKISIWEIGNEPEGDPNKILNNPHKYTVIARSIAKNIIKNAPKAHVAALSTAWMDRPFISECLKNGLLSDRTIDILSFHGYHRSTIFPESGLANDVSWLRSIISKYRPPGKNVIIIDSERGYAIHPFLSPKHKDIYRNVVYSEEEQAAYLARHYLEEISLGIEVSIWYKDMWGEDSFSLFEKGPNSRIRPMGYALRNLSEIFTKNPKEMINTRYPVDIIYSNKVGAFQKPKVLLRSYLVNQAKTLNSEKLILAVWNPVESFNGKILESRIQKGEQFLEKWREVRSTDHVNVPLYLNISNVDKNKIKKVSSINLLEQNHSFTSKPLNFKNDKNKLLLNLSNVGPIPTIIEIEIFSKSKY